MRRWNLFFCLLGMLLAAHDSIAESAVVSLPEFKVEGTAWRYGRVGEIEVLTRASDVRTKEFLAGLIRGMRLLPDFMVKEVRLPLTVILVDETRRPVAGLSKLKEAGADARDWPEGSTKFDGATVDKVENGVQILAVNVGGVESLWPVLMNHAIASMGAQRPAFPDWVKWGLFGPSGVLRQVVGIPRSTSVRLPKLSWPAATEGVDKLPPEAGDIPDFATMFGVERKRETMTDEEKARFDFQSALFARWSLFGPAKNGRNRNGYWAFVEMARRGQATEAIFRECYGMDWAQACAEMRVYLKPRNTGVIEVRMPPVMADVPEAERMEFCDATGEEVRRIFSEFNRLRASRRRAQYRHANKRRRSPRTCSFGRASFPTNKSGINPITKHEIRNERTDVSRNGTSRWRDMGSPSRSHRGYRGIFFREGARK